MSTTPFYGNAYVGVEERQERDAWIVSLAADHTVGQIAEIAGLHFSRISQILKKAGIPRRGYYGSLCADDPAPQPKLARQCRAIGFETFGADYMRCWTCKFRWFNGYGKPTFCPRCHTTDTRVIYRPANGAING